MWLKNNKGFYLVDLLISLSGWIMISSLLVPMYIQLNKQTVKLQEEQTALQILYEYAQKVTFEEADRENFNIRKNNKEYEIFWVEQLNDEKGEVCVQYEDIFGSTVQIYERVQ